MEMVSASFLTLALLLGGQVGLPLGLPPLAEDPILSHAAPEECLAYFSWSGVTEPDRTSKNQTEQLLAEPEVKQFVATVGKALGAAIRKGAPATPQGQVLGAQGPKLIHALLTHSAALFIAKVAAGPPGPELSGGLIVATGPQTDELKSSLEQIEKVLLAGGASAAGDTPWHKLPAMPNIPAVEWGFRGKYLVVGVGAGSADEIVRRMAGRSPAWLANLKQRLSVERVSTVLYVDVKEVIELAGPLFGGSNGRQIREALGLDNVRTIASVSGLEGTGRISKTWVETNGEPSGLLTMFGPEPLKAVDLAPIPKDASFAIVARVHPTRLFEAMLEAVKKLNPEIPDVNVGQLEQMEGLLGFRLKEDLLDTLGDSWCLYNSPGEGGLLVTGLTIVVPVKDRERLAKTNDRLVQLARDNPSPVPSIKETQFGGSRVFYLNPTGGEVLPFAPAWCVGDQHLILSLSPQNVRAFLARESAAGSLADLPVVAEKLKSGRPILLSFQDTAGMLKITYPILQIFATLGFSEMQREGIDLDASLLPSLASILRHVEPGVGTLSREKNSLVYVSRHSLPIGVEFPVLTVATGFLGFSGPVRTIETQPPPAVQDLQRIEIEKAPETKPDR